MPREEIQDPPPGFPAPLYFVAAVWMLAGLTFFALITIDAIRSGEWIGGLIVAPVSGYLLSNSLRLIFGHLRSTFTIGAASIISFLLIFVIARMAAEDSQYVVAVRIIAVIVAFVTTLAGVAAMECHEHYLQWREHCLAEEDDDE